MFVPTKWVKSAWSFGDRTFERFLENICKSSKQRRESLSNNGSQYYEADRELQDKSNFFDELESMPRPSLVEEIKLHVNKNRNLMKRNKELEKLIAGKQTETTPDTPAAWTQ